MPGVVPLGAGGVRLDAVRREEAPQAGVQVAGAEVGEAEDRPLALVKVQAGGLWRLRCRPPPPHSP